MLSDQIDVLQDKRDDLGEDFGAHVRVSKAITANVVAAGKEMQNVRLGGSMTPMTPDPKHPEFARDVAA